MKPVQQKTCRVFSVNDIITMPNIIKVGLFSRGQFYQQHMHKHDFSTEIIFNLKGVAHVFVNNKEYYAQPGDVIIYPQGQLHYEEFFCNSEDIENLYIRIFDYQLRDLPPNILLPEDFPNVLYSGEWRDDIEFCMRNIQKECLNRQYGYMSIINNLIAQLMIVLLRLISLNRQKEESEKDLIVQKILSYINAHYKQEINVNKIAAALDMSHSHLTHTFAQYMNISPARYIASHRIFEAKRLLLISTESIRQIAENVGYTNLSSFNEQFKRNTGMTPSKYRIKYRNYEDQTYI